MLFLLLLLTAMHLTQLHVLLCLAFRCSRATVFSVINPQGGLQFFTPHHVVAPWRYPKYHADQMPWLQYVREQHCTYRVDVKNATDSEDIVSCLLGQVLVTYTHN
jgi:hypothetical protein